MMIFPMCLNPWRLFWRLIWNASELLVLPCPKAGWVFGQCMGAKGHRLVLSAPFTPCKVAYPGPGWCCDGCECATPADCKTKEGQSIVAARAFAAEWACPKCAATQYGSSVRPDDVGTHCRRCAIVLGEIKIGVCE